MSYKSAQFNTINRAEITIALFDGAIRFLEQAEVKIKEKDMVAKGNLISKALDILGELDASLNMEIGGPLGKGLHDFYSLCNSHLLMANLKLDLELLNSTKENIKSVRNAFAEAMQTAEAKEALSKMGPLPQTASGNISNIKHGGIISAKSEHIKQLEEKAKALELAKQKINNASSDVEKLEAQKSLENTLQTHKIQTPNPQAPSNPMYNPNQGLMNRKMALYKNMQGA